MELTREKAIELSIELWTWLARTGERKSEWPGWKKNGGSYEPVAADCFLCAWVESLDRGLCLACPLYEHYGYTCMDTCSPFWMWDTCFPTTTKLKRHAKAFLMQLRELADGGAR